MIEQIFMLALLCITAGVSQWVYIGGTAINNILFLLLVDPLALSYSSIKLTMPIAYGLLMGGTLYLIIKDFKKYEQDGSQCKFDYAMMGIALPLSASGALFGVLSSNFISDFLTSIIFIVLTGFFISKIKNQYNLQLHQPLINNQTQTQLQSIQHLHDQNILNLKHHKNRTDYEADPELQKMIQQQNHRIPRSGIKIAIFVLLYSFVVIALRNVSSDELIVVNPQIIPPEGWIQPIQTSKTLNISIKRLNNSFDPYISSSGFSSCVIGSFVLIIVHLILSYLSSKSVAIQTAFRDEEKLKLGFVFKKQSDKMDAVKMWQSMLSGFFGGFLVGIFGIGSSLILQPVWISCGSNKQTARYSSTPITFFAALIAMGYSANKGSFNIWLMLLVILFAFASTALVHFILQKGNTNSTKQKIKLSLFVISLIALSIYGVFGYVSNPLFTKLGYFC